jgi:hypothetical protein
MNLREVAVLCVSGRSIYKHQPGVLAYDKNLDAKNFSGGMPVVAHPPCRCWSYYLASQARPKDRSAEMALGVWCVEQVMKHGGVLEHPARSLLWDACKLPKPADLGDPFLYTVYIEQGWFGFGSRKPTWVLVSGVPPAELAPIGFRLQAFGTTKGMTSFQRSRTSSEMASWLLDTARKTWFSLQGRRNGIVL